MKKNGKMFFITGFLVATLGFAGCQNESVMEKSQSAESEFGKVLEETFTLYQKTLTTVGNYVDLPPSSRSAFAKEKSISEYFLELGKELPSTLSELKRKNESSSRSAVVSTEDVSLQDELNLIAEEYTNLIDSALPDLEKIKELEGVEVIDDVIYLSNGIAVKAHSLEGVLICEYLLKIAEGSGSEEALLKIENDVENILSSYNTDSKARGAYLTDGILGYGSRWNDGKIYYRWDDIEEEDKKALIEAMSDWEEKVNKDEEGNYLKRIEFIELEETNWNTFCTILGTINVIYFKTGELSENVSGQTFPLGRAYNGYLKISKAIVPTQLHRTSRHELGHVLGLFHEHQRADRDKYIKVDKVDISFKTFIDDMTESFNYGTIPEYLGGLVWKTKKVSVFGLKIYLPYLSWSDKATQISSLVGPFDFKSIMLYSGFEIPNEEYYCYGEIDITDGVYRTGYNEQISDTDIKTVQKMYGGKK